MIKTYIVRTDSPEVRDRLETLFEKVGSPRALLKTVLVSTSEHISEIERIEGVISVHIDEVIHTAYIQQDTPNWALGRICGGNEYEYEKTGDGVDVYILDCGIKTNHIEFAHGQVETIYPQGEDGVDASKPHGTIAASQVGGQTCGVAKNVNIKNVKMYVSNSSSVIKGIDRIAEHHSLKTNGFPSILSMSFGSTNLSWLEDETLELVDLGIICVASAHNYGEPQSTAPACHPWVLSVGATDQNNNLAYFSNYGPTVDILAPGYLNYAADLNGYSTSHYGYYCGTSFSCPIVAGVLALICEGKTVKNRTDVERIIASLLNYANTTKITSKLDTTNRFVYSLLPTIGGRIFLDKGETGITIANSGVTVYGQNGFEGINILPGVVGVYVDGNVEEVFFHKRISEYTFKQRGNKLIVYNHGLLIVKLSIQSKGLRLVFGEVHKVTFKQGVIKVDGVTVPQS